MCSLISESRCFNIVFFFFFFNDTATTEIYTLSLHDALPICPTAACDRTREPPRAWPAPRADRKSTRLNSSHLGISYAVFCLKKKKIKTTTFSISKITFQKIERKIRDHRD